VNHPISRFLLDDGRHRRRLVFGLAGPRGLLPAALGSLLLLLVLGQGCVAGARGGDLQAQFDEANRLYEQGRFSDAAAAYDRLAQSGAASTALYFNLGNAWYKSGQLGRAMASYQMAARFEPRDPDLRANLRFIRNQIQAPTLTPGRWQRWLGRLTLNEWAVMASVPMWLCLLLVALFQFKPALRSPWRTTALGLGLAAVILWTCCGAACLAASAKMTIVIAREATVRNGPLDESPQVFTVHDGAELEILDRKGDWLQVSAGRGRLGWLKREVVSPPE
jgi:tetratricopeptide (TPR) repeat protein